MVRVPNMGMRRDLAQRVSLARVDDVDRRARLHAARIAIYENNHPVDGAAVKRLLNQDSLVPSAVSGFFDIRLRSTSDLSFFFRTHSQINCHHSILTCSTWWL